MEVTKLSKATYLVDMISIAYTMSNGNLCTWLRQLHAGEVPLVGEVEGTTMKFIQDNMVKVAKTCAAKHQGRHVIVK